VAADVPARRAEPRVTEDAHELGPQAGHSDGVEGRAGGPAGVAVARQVGRDHVERVGGVGAVPAGVGEERDDLCVTPERVRPAVAEDQRQDGPGRRGRPDVHEVDPQVPERDAEAGKPGQRRLLRRPVEPVRPVGDELAEVAEVGPERPPGVLGRVRPARRAQPRAEVLERPGGGLRCERLGVRSVRHGRILRAASRSPVAGPRSPVAAPRSPVAAPPGPRPRPRPRRAGARASRRRRPPGSLRPERNRSRRKPQRGKSAHALLAVITYSVSAGPAGRDGPRRGGAASGAGRAVPPTAAAGGRLHPGPDLLDGTAVHAALLRQVHQNHPAVVRRLLPGDHPARSRGCDPAGPRALRIDQRGGVTARTALRSQIFKFCHLSGAEGACPLGHKEAWSGERSSWPGRPPTVRAAGPSGP